MAEKFEVFFVKNKEGKYFRAKGYGGYGETWVDDIKKAKLYTKIGQARSRVTFFKSNWPEYGTPDIIVMTVGNPKVLDETSRNERVARQRLQKEEREAKAAKERALDRAESELRSAQERLAALKVYGKAES